VKPALLAVLGAVTLVLVIAAVNVTNLLLTRIPLRAREFSMRSALGAARGRIVRQLLIESFLLAAIGGGFGVVVAQLGVRALIALSPAGLPRLGAIAIDSSVLAFTVGVTAVIGIAVGLFPALRISRPDLQSSIQRTSTRNTPSHQWTRRALVVVQVSLAVILLVGAGLLLRSLTRIFAIDPGFSAAQVLTMQIQTAGRAVETDAAKHAFFRAAIQRAKQVPGVNAAALTSQLPISGDLDEYGAQFEGDDAGAGYSVYRYSVTPEYFDAMHIPLRKGRPLDDHDVAGSLPVILISESLAQRKFVAQNPLRRRIRVGGGPNAPWYTIVGVVGDVRQVSLALNQSDAVYTHTEQWPSADDSMSVVVRTRGDAAAMASAIRGAISSVDKDQPILRVATMDSLLLKSEAERRFSQILFAAFGMTALLLAAIGLYGVLTSNVTERTREIGIRSALGATRGNILALIAGQGMLLVAIGALLGLAGALVATKAVTSMLYGISRLDAVTYAGVAGLLVAVSAVACSLPAWRASRVDPCVALRSE
jgi:putative ABC transport system permease protein